MRALNNGELGYLFYVGEQPKGQHKGEYERTGNLTTHTKVPKTTILTLQETTIDSCVKSKRDWSQKKGNHLFVEKSGEEMAFQKLLWLSLFSFF